MVLAGEASTEMMPRQHRQSPLRRLWMPLLTAAFLGYFGFHTFNGSYGKWALDRMVVQAAALDSQLADLKREPTELPNPVSFLQPYTLAPTLVHVEALPH